MSHDDILSEKISAYLDGALDAETQRAFEADMAASPILAAQVEAQRTADAALRAAFAAPLHEPVPEKLMALLSAPSAATETAAQKTSAPNVVDFAAARSKRTAPLAPARRAWGGYAAIAASLLVALVVGTQMRPGHRADPLSLALDTTASGQTATLADGRTVTPVLSFAAGDGRYCREYRSGGTRTLACRTAGAWHEEAQSPDDAQTGGPGYATAGGSTALDAAYERLKAGDPLDAADEAALIARKWTARP